MIILMVILMIKWHLLKSCLDWLTPVRLIIVLRIISRILVRIILRIWPVSRMRIRPVIGIWFRLNNPYSSPTITTLSFLSIFITLIDFQIDWYLGWVLLRMNFKFHIQRFDEILSINVETIRYLMLWLGDFTKNLVKTRW